MFVDHRDPGTRLDGVTLAGENLDEYSSGGRRHLGVDLVGRNFEQWFIAGDGVAHFLEPLRDDSLGNRFTQ
jgi:hypothetical protein